MELPAEALESRGKDRTVKDVLTEDQVVMFVVENFNSREFINVKYNLTGSQGDDVTATDPSTEETWVVECKGEIKSKANADGTLAAPFTRNMCRQSIEAALYKAMKCRSEAILDPKWKRRVAMAFPNTPHYRDHLKLIIPCLKAAGIEVLLVDVKGSVVIAPRSACPET
jgi:hypothetical protein